MFHIGDSISQTDEAIAAAEPVSSDVIGILLECGRQRLLERKDAERREAESAQAEAERRWLALFSVAEADCGPVARFLPRARPADFDNAVEDGNDLVRDWFAFQLEIPGIGRIARVYQLVGGRWYPASPVSSEAKWAAVTFRLHFQDSSGGGVDRVELLPKDEEFWVWSDLFEEALANAVEVSADLPALEAEASRANLALAEQRATPSPRPPTRAEKLLAALTEFMEETLDNFTYEEVG